MPRSPCIRFSYKKNVSVNTLIARGFPYTLSIGLLSIAVSAFIGILMGIWMATSKRLAVKNTLLGIATLGSVSRDSSQRSC